MKNLKIYALIAVFFLLVGSALGFLVNSKLINKSLSTDELKTKVSSYLESKGVDYKVYDIKKYDSGMYVATVATPQGDVPAYITSSGKTLSFSVVDVDSESEVSQNAANQIKDPVKSEKPVVELFVMSHCPYGTQIEKGILPVVNTLGDKIDFQLKFVNYAMHGQKEIDEQLSQYCINKLYPSNLTSYLSCFLESEDGKACIASEGLSSADIASCVASADTEFGISESYEDKSTWRGSYPSFAVHNDENVKYGVAGSPTLVVNGVNTSTGRSPSSLLTSICASFENQPEECSAELSSEVPSPGFGSGTAGSNTDASCN